MSSYSVIFEPRAIAQLEALEAYIAKEGSPRAATRFVTAIVAYCQTLDQFPLRGTPRDDIRLGLRTLVFRRRTVIVYAVEDDEVHVLTIAYGGRDLVEALGR